MKQSIWHNCYDDNLKSLITPESFAHPAKMAKRLTERIFDYGAEQGYWQPGQVIVDCFGGIGTTGLIGSYRGYRVVSVELEPRFVDMHRANIAKNTRKLQALGRPLPVVIQGDSRQLAALLGECVGAVSSPPYADGSAHTGGNDPHPERMTGGKFYGVGLNGAISSPPYADSINGGEGPGARYDFSCNRSEPIKQTSDAAYGVSEGQIGALREGEFESVVGAVTSPPYENSINSETNGIDWTKVKPDYPGRVMHAERIAMSERHHNNRKYGEAENGNIGAESGETYWQAMAQVYAGLYQVLKPGGVAAVVVKDFVRNRQIVPLCDRTAQLLEATGFTVIERTRAMLVKEQHAGIDMFSGEHVTKRVERKSFFRRLAEAKGSPAIDFEEIIWARKP